jgi:hypothetical protein
LIAKLGSRSSGALAPRLLLILRAFPQATTFRGAISDEMNSWLDPDWTELCATIKTRPRLGFLCRSEGAGREHLSGACCASDAKIGQEHLQHERRVRTAYAPFPQGLTGARKIVWAVDGSDIEDRSEVPNDIYVG